MGVMIRYCRADNIAFSATTARCATCGEVRPTYDAFALVEELAAELTKLEGELDKELLPDTPAPLPRAKELARAGQREESA